MTLQEYLIANHRQGMPAWLRRFDPAYPPSGRTLASSFFNSCLVFYPGSGGDGSTVQFFNEGRAAHCFLYVDYGMTRDAVLEELEARGFRGYSTIACIDLAESDFRTGQWKPHVLPSEVHYSFPTVTPYAFIAILEKQLTATVDGAARLAIMFLAADGHAAYDALFCQEQSGPPPLCVVLQDHGFGGNHSPFGSEGLMEKVAERTGRFPSLLLVGDNTAPWRGYNRRPDVNPIQVTSLRRRLLYCRA